MKSKNIWKYAFNWGSIIGGIYLLYRLIGFFLKLETSFLWSLIGTFILVFGMGWAMINYKKNVLRQNITFGKFFAIGTIMSLVIAFFSTLFLTIYAVKLNPSFLDDFLMQYQELLDSVDPSINVYENEEFRSIIQAVFIPSNYVFSFIGNLFYVLILSLLLTRPSFGANIQPLDKDNDYVPYKEVSEEPEVTEEEDEKLEEENK
ncbi:MAG: DUF4199 domain-containing protein [Bacteroidales bacterium]|jgi:hypothetical protein|nr:DUF4199 domain-containing protein [Bacteroidales bacterium]MDD4703748.1 DUF4199 domain-containing protein [Bacteroidales bacterium]MDX9798355.1 DUF4199 domain-containing protein [Bacteroidales bacterium]